MTNKSKKMIKKGEKYADFGPKPRRLASDLKINITKMGKTLKSENL